MASYYDNLEDPELDPALIPPTVDPAVAGMPNKDVLRQKLYSNLMGRLKGADPLAADRKEIADEDRRNSFLASLQQSTNKLGAIGGKSIENNSLGQVASSLGESNRADLGAKAQSLGQRDKVQDYLLGQIQKSDQVDAQMKARAAERQAQLNQQLMLAKEKSEQAKTFHDDNMQLRREVAGNANRSRYQVAGQDADGNFLTMDASTGMIGNSGQKGTKVGGDPNGKMPNKDQFDAAMYGRRLESAEAVLDDLADSGYNRASRMEGLKAKLTPDAAKGNNLKKMEQAERNFINAVLRRESGAAIAASEFENGVQQYFPRAGDTPDVLAQKTQNRKQAVMGMKAASGNAWDRVEAVPLIAAKKPAESGTAYAGQTAPPPAGKVRVKSPDGKIGLIPKEDLDNALAEKYEVIN